MIPSRPFARLRARRAQQQGVTVRRGAGHHLGASHAGGAGPIVDDHWLTECIAQPLRDHAGEDVVRPSGREADDHADRFARKALRAHAGAAQAIKVAAKNSLNEQPMCNSPMAMDPMRASASLK